LDCRPQPPRPLECGIDDPHEQRELKAELIDVAEIVGSALQQAGNILGEMDLVDQVTHSFR